MQPFEEEGGEKRGEGGIWRESETDGGGGGRGRGSEWGGRKDGRGTTDGTVYSLSRSLSALTSFSRNLWALPSKSCPPSRSIGSNVQLLFARSEDTRRENYIIRREDRACEQSHCIEKNCIELSKPKHCQCITCKLDMVLIPSLEHSIYSCLSPYHSLTSCSLECTLVSALPVSDAAPDFLATCITCSHVVVRGNN